MTKIKEKNETRILPKLRFPEFGNSPEMKQVKKGLVPKLRFPDFKIVWQEVILSSVLNEHRLKNDGKSKVHSVSVHKGIVDQIEHLGRSFAASDTSKYNLVKPFDIVYTKSPTGDFPFGIIKQSRLNYNVIVSPLYGVFSPKNKYLGYILDCYFESPIRTKNYLDPITQKGAKNTIQISNDTFISRGLYLPEDEIEQQKIADCLSSLDELIDAEDKKLESLRLHKKVLMQELFPAEGQTLPKLHFPEFGNSPEWKTKKLGQIGDILMCKRIFAQETNDKGGIPFYKIGTLGGKPDAFIAKELFEEYKSKYNYPKKDEVLITCSGTVGKCLAFDGNDSYYQDSNIVWIDNKSLEISNKFLLILLSNTDWTKLNSTTITRIYGSDLRELSFVFPADEKEQQHIADFLSSIDNLITTQTKKLESLRLHKKGLMQQLFPNICEVKE